MTKLDGYEVVTQNVTFGIYCISSFVWTLFKIEKNKTEILNSGMEG